MRPQNLAITATAITLIAALTISSGATSAFADQSGVRNAERSYLGRTNRGFERRDRRRRMAVRSWRQRQSASQYQYSQYPLWAARAFEPANGFGK